MSRTFTNVEGGLDLSNPESWTEAEQEAFTARYLKVKGRTMPGHDLWINLRPDVMKRYWQYAQTMNTDLGADYAHIAPLCYLHDYAVIGWPEGIQYQITNAHVRGIDKNAFVSTLAVAFLHSGPLGTSAVAQSAREQIVSLPPPESPARWPDGWGPDPDYFLSGLDFADPQLSKEELALVEAWYERAVSEVPRNVAFLARHHPQLLKAFRHRFEFALKDGLPKQMMPLFMLQFEVIRGRSEGIRQAALMARAMGIDKSFALGAIARGGLYGGPTAVSIVDESAGDVFDGWDDAVR